MLLKNSMLRFLVVTIFTFSAFVSAPVTSANEKSDRSYDSSCKDKGGEENSHSSINSLSERGSKSKSKSKSSNDDDKRGSKKKCDDEGKDDSRDDEDKPKEQEEVYVKTPSAVSGLVISTCSASVTLTWSAPTKPRSIPVSNYQIRYSTDSGLTWTTHPVSATQTTITVDGLTAGATYIFQVAAQNINGLGTWSTSSATCTIPNPNTSAFTFVISGLENVSGAGLNYSIDGTNPEEVFIVQVNAPQSGSLSKGLFTHDLYLSLPAGTGNGYSFSVNGTPITSAGYTFFSNASSMGVGHPVIRQENLFFYEFAETYAFNITTGNSITIAISIAPLP